MYIMYYLYDHRHTGRGYSRVKLVWDSPWDLFAPSASVWMIPGTYDELPMGDAYPTLQSVLDQKAFADRIMREISGYCASGALE